MSITTQIETTGLARDPSAAVASSRGALRLAEDVVVRSPGVIETRPSFDIEIDGLTTTRRVRGLHEFGGGIVAVEQDDVDPSAWTVSLDNNDVQCLTEGAYEPPSYDDSEPRFAHARRNLYFTGYFGAVAVENIDIGIASQTRCAGMEPPTMVTDYRSPSESYDVPRAAWSYRFVIRRTDTNGVILRSPPSQRVLCFAGTAAPFPDSTGTRFYIMTSTGSPARLKKNDVIEVYRTRINTAGLEAGSEHYKAFEYEITLTDISNGYVDLPDDKTADDDLGVALYTNSAQDGETAQKYPPPRAKQLAPWSRCMWYGDVRPKARFNLRLVNFGASGYGYIRAGGVTFTSGSDLITGFADTSGFKVGEYLTDNLQHGPGTAGTYIPADSTITNITSATSLQISNLALASGTLAPTSFVQVMQKNVPRGLHAFRGTGTYTSGSAVVTGISDTTGLYAGMYVTDSANGPTTNGTRVPTGTLIQSVDSSTQITMTANALASGTAQTFIAGDYLTVNSVRFHAWPREILSYLADDWTMPAQCFTVTGSAGQDASGGRGIMMLAMCNLATAVNRYCLATKGYHVRAIPLGDHTTRWYTDGSGGVGEPAAVGTIGISFEEIGQSGILPSLSTSCPTAWDVGLAATADDPTTLNRVCWSAVDEPEAVPLLNYVNIGAADKRVLALVPLRNALLVFKEDGCWRITGAPPSSWNVDLLDPTLQLLRPEVVSVSQNAAYAWCRGGFFEVTENGARSLTAGRLDVELRTSAAYLSNPDPITHGAFVAVVQQRNLVLLGVPGQRHGEAACAKVYAYNQTTGAWSEWALVWGHVCESEALDTMYASVTRAGDDYTTAIGYEIDKMQADVRGYDRTFTLGASAAVTGTTLAVNFAHVEAWSPAVGDIVKAEDAADPSIYVFRRVTAVSQSLTQWLITIDDTLPALATEHSYTFTAYVTAKVVLEWHPTGPAGVPQSVLARELTFQIDHRDATAEAPAPRYAIGGSSDLSATRYTVTATPAAVATVQPLRCGVSRQIARSALIAPYLSTSQLYPVRVNGASIVHEGVSEKVRR